MIPTIAASYGATSFAHVAVLIPARNEEQLLPRCLESVQAARRRLPRWVTSDVVVVADRCDDDTEATAARLLAGTGVAVACSEGAVGAARAIAARLALRRAPWPAERCWLANTDADCEVPATWLVDQLRIASRAVEAVAGIVEVHDFSEHLPHVAQRFHDTYRIDPCGTHPHVHGANLGVRADAYMRVGGWSPLHTAEDHDLWGRLRAMGHTCASDAALRVVTSGRRIGRAPSGFAGALAAHNEIAA